VQKGLQISACAGHDVGGGLPIGPGLRREVAGDGDHDLVVLGLPVGYCVLMARHLPVHLFAQAFGVQTAKAPQGIHVGVPKESAFVIGVIVRPGDVIDRLIDPATASQSSNGPMHQTARQVEGGPRNIRDEL